MSTGTSANFEPTRNRDSTAVVIKLGEPLLSGLPTATRYVLSKPGERMRAPIQTPHTRIPGLARMLGGPTDLEIYLKNESLQPACSVKSRVAYAMVRQSILLKKPIVESSSGNLALGLGYWCDQLGAPQPLCLIDDCCEQSMRDAMSDAGCLIRVLELTAEEHDRQTGVLKRIEVAKAFAEQGYYWPNQYDCRKWVQVHEATTGPEIWNDGTAYSLVVAAAGTGATVSGIALSRPATSKSQVVAVEPLGSSIFGMQPGPYRVAGAGNPFTPQNYLCRVIDLELAVSDRDAFSAAGIMRAAGIRIGSSGATAVLGALRVAMKLRRGRRVALVVIADDGWYENF